MNLPELYARAKPWLKPGITVFLGLVLMFRPDSVTSALGTVIGFLVALAGSALMISFFFGHRKKDGLRLAGAIILMVLGFSVIKYPLSLATQAGRFIGILLVLQSARELTGEIPLRSKTMSAVSGVIGLVLMLVPMTSSRLLVTGCGVVVTLMGVGMLLAHKKESSGKDDIIDAR